MVSISYKLTKYKDLSPFSPTAREEKEERSLNGFVGIRLMERQGSATLMYPALCQADPRRLQPSWLTGERGYGR